MPNIEPDAPLVRWVATSGRSLDDVAFVYLDASGSLLAAVNPHDCIPPTASVESLPPYVETASFAVTWSGSDTWSGIADYDVQVQDGYEGTWEGWLTGTPLTSSLYTGGHGHTYYFRARARDQFGTESMFGDDPNGQTYTTVLTEPAAVLVTSQKLACNRASPDVPCFFAAHEPIAYTLHISNTGNLPATVVLTDTPPVELVVLTHTLAATGGLSPTYTGGQIRWSGTVAPGAQVQVTYVLSPTVATPFGIPLTNTVTIEGSVLGPFTRRKTVTKAYSTWLPLALKQLTP